MPKVNIKIGMQFNRSNPAAIEWARQHAADLVTDISETTRERIRTEVEDAFEEGTSTRDLVDAIEGIVNDRDRAELIAGHESMTAANEGQRQSWDQATEAGLLDGSEKREWIAAGDNGVCDDCDALDGETTDLDGEYPNDGGEGPPLHVACVIGSTVVQGNVIAAARMLYVGQIREILTVSGKRLSITKNHPVATLRGFVAAGSVNEGDYLLSYDQGIIGDRVNTKAASEHPNAAFSLPDNDQNRPTSIEQVFQSCTVIGKAVHVRRFGNEFHGDAHFGDSDIDVVYADVELGNYAESTFLHQQERLGFEASNFSASRLGNTLLMNKSTLLAESTVDEVSVRGIGGEPFEGSFERITQSNSALNESNTNPTSGEPSFIGESEQRLSIFVSLDKTTNDIIRDRKPAKPHTFQVGATAHLDAVLLKASRETRTWDSSFVRDLEERLTRQISRDQIVKIRDIDFWGHVYDLNTVSGIIVANSLIISNCRCTEGIVG